jgi:hypothetical protein
MTVDRIVSRILLLGGLLVGACGSNTEPGDGGGSAAPPPRLFINELQPSNQDTITDENGEADDWIEIFNAGDSPVDMHGLVLADSSGTSQVIAGSVIVAAGAFQLLWADDSPSQGPNHLGFKLSGKSGDKVTLKDGSGRTLDTITFGPTTGQDTYARFPDGTGAFAWCTAPTPGASNGSACGVP